VITAEYTFTRCLGEEEGEGTVGSLRRINVIALCGYSVPVRKKTTRRCHDVMITDTVSLMTRRIGGPTVITEPDMTRRCRDRSCGDLTSVSTPLQTTQGRCPFISCDFRRACPSAAFSRQHEGDMRPFCRPSPYPKVAARRPQ
jgi:hypothetical protein